jgi:hypothetical protein
MGRAAEDGINATGGRMACGQIADCLDDVEAERWDASSLAGGWHGQGVSLTAPLCVVSGPTTPELAWHMSHVWRCFVCSLNRMDCLGHQTLVWQ